jgi:hypothetical protein
MAAVTFAIGSRPGLNRFEAEDLAELLELRGTLAAARLAGKIRTQAARDPNRHEPGDDVELDPDEASVLAAELAIVLAEPRSARERPAFAHLRDEVAHHLAG